MIERLTPEVKHKAFKIVLATFILYSLTYTDGIIQGIMEYELFPGFPVRNVFGILGVYFLVLYHRRQI